MSKPFELKSPQHLLLEAQASRPEDRRSILHFVAKTPQDQRAAEPPSHHQNYDELNRAVHQRFAVGALYRAAAGGELVRLQALLGDFPEAVNGSIADGP